MIFLANFAYEQNSTYFNNYGGVEARRPGRVGFSSMVEILVYFKLYNFLISFSFFLYHLFYKII